MVTGDVLRKAMAKFVTGVTLLATPKEDGSVQAMTANAVASISLDPPLVLVSVGHTRNTFHHLQNNGRYTINVLRREQDEAARYYAKDERDRTGNVPVNYIRSRRGMPVVEGCLAFLDCDVVATHQYGDHTIFVAEVLETYTSAGEPLLFYNHRLRGLGE